MTPEEQKEVASTLTSAYDELTFNLLESKLGRRHYGRQGSSRNVWSASLLLLYSCWFILRSASVRSAVSAGLTAIVALLHDVLISFCVFVVFGMPINDIFIAVVLTILGYSLNSTIVIYDRVRENKRKMGPRVNFTDVMNLSLNQTLGRTLLTSLTTFLALLVVLIVAAAFGISTVVSLCPAYDGRCCGRLFLLSVYRPQPFLPCGRFGKREKLNAK